MKQIRPRSYLPDSTTVIPTESVAKSCPPDGEAQLILGKKVKHKFEESGEEKWYEGKVVSQVPGSPAWFNIIYDSFPEDTYIFTLLDDYFSQDLVVIDVS